MKKENKNFIFIVIVSILIMAALTPFMINQSNDSFERFRLKAESALGTSNFTICLYDELMVAETPDGRQYPDEAFVDEYFHNKLMNSLLLFGVAALLALVVVVIVYFWGWKLHAGLSQDDPLITNIQKSHIYTKKGRVFDSTFVKSFRPCKFCFHLLPNYSEYTGCLILAVSIPYSF